MRYFLGILVPSEYDLIFTGKQDSFAAAIANISDDFVTGAMKRSMMLNWTDRTSVKFFGYVSSYIGLLSAGSVTSSPEAKSDAISETGARTKEFAKSYLEHSRKARLRLS